MGHPNKGRHKTDTLTEQDEHSNQHPTLNSLQFFLKVSSKIWQKLNSNAVGILNFRWNKFNNFKSFF